MCRFRERDEIADQFSPPPSKGRPRTFTNEKKNLSPLTFFLFRYIPKQKIKYSGNPPGDHKADLPKIFNLTRRSGSGFTSVFYSQSWFRLQRATPVHICLEPSSRFAQSVSSGGWFPSGSTFPGTCPISLSFSTKQTFKSLLFQFLNRELKLFDRTSSAIREWKKTSVLSIKFSLSPRIHCFALQFSLC